jgi:serine protease SohB
MEFLIDYGLFLAKTLTIVVAILAIIAGIVAISTRSRAGTRERIEVKHLNQRYQNMAQALEGAILPKKELKRVLKARKKQRKAEQRQAGSSRKKVFVLNFHGNVMASALSSLREEITALLTIATPHDEVFLCLESGGGLVHAYGLAASQLLRIKARQIPLTVAVDRVAASGGYMMAAVADRLIAAPFAVVGSIGVVAQLPNFHRLLKKNDIDYEQITAGEYKRTLTLFGENTEKARDKVRQEVENAHGLFKDFIKEHRGQLDLDRIATGEHWFGARALELKLVDELRTSDDYLMEANQAADLYEVTYTSHKPFTTRLGLHVARWLKRSGVARMLGDDLGIHSLIDQGIENRTL